MILGKDLPGGCASLTHSIAYDRYHRVARRRIDENGTWQNPQVSIGADTLEVGFGFWAPGSMGSGSLFSADHGAPTKGSNGLLKALQRFLASERSFMAPFKDLWPLKGLSWPSKLLEAYMRISLLSSRSEET